MLLSSQKVEYDRGSHVQVGSLKPLKALQGWSTKYAYRVYSYIYTHKHTHTHTQFIVAGALSVV